MAHKTDNAAPAGSCGEERAARSKREPGTARVRTLDYGTPYPYWLRGKVKRIRR